MRTDGGRESDNVEDQRGMGGRGMAVGGGVGTLVIALIVYLMGGDPRAVLQNAPGGGGGGGVAVTGRPPDKASEDELTKFVRIVLAETENVWREQFPKQTGRPYVDPK